MLKVGSIMNIAFFAAFSHLLELIQPSMTVDAVKAKASSDASSTNQ